MVVASNKYDFFESGYSFYESSLMDFTTALRSVRLYLQMEDMARKDGLTSIYNRAYFNESYKKIVKNVLDEKLRLTVALMDIDKFKSINDTYGHLAGDEVIKMVARLDNKFAEMNGGIAVRYGGEEFLMILTGKGLDESIEILKEMHKEIRTTAVNYDNLTIDINTSVGVASYPDTTSNIEEVLDRADRAMYYSKEHGRGHIIIDGKEEESYNTIQDI
jgi:diguanylate cyclase (GGDEF)-like protein